MVLLNHIGWGCFNMKYFYDFILWGAADALKSKKLSLGVRLLLGALVIIVALAILNNI